MIKRIAGAFLLVALFVVAQGQSIPKWKIEDVVKSYAAKNDTVYVVNFWATFCKPCIEEIPDFIRLVEKYKTQKVRLLLVSLDLPAMYPNKLAAFAAKNNYTASIAWLNETNADHFCPMIDEKWSGAIPSTLIVNNSNGYRKFVEDQMSAAEFESALLEAIGQAAATYKAPMNDAEVDDKDAGAFVTFTSNDSAVYAIQGGKVKMIAKIDHMKVVMVEKDEFFYTYSNLGSTTVKTGDIITADQLIGYAAPNLDGIKPTLELYVNDATANIHLSKENFTRRNNARLMDHSIDRVKDPQ